MRKIGRYRRKKQKKILIIGSLSLLLFLCVGYAAFSTNLSITAKGNVKEKTRVIQAWSRTDQTDFHSDFYKQNIVSATFVNNNKVPNNAAESWNVSEDKENGGVMAWVVPSSSDNDKYDLYIGAKSGVIANEDSSNLFYNFSNVSEINFNNNFDTSNTVNMDQMFNNCTRLVSLDLSSFDTRNVTSMYAMFLMWDSEIDVAPENQLISINFGKTFITTNVTNMRDMFAGLTKLQSLDLSNFDTGNVTNMYHMFNQCSSLTSLDLHSFDTRNVTTMQYMFLKCSSLTEINLCSFNTNKVIDMMGMFASTPNLKKVYVGSNWTTANADTTAIFWQSSVSSVTTGQC